MTQLQTQLPLDIPSSRFLLEVVWVKIWTVIYTFGNCQVYVGKGGVLLLFYFKMYHFQIATLIKVCIGKIEVVLF